jgi:MSHA biogenesis protein MshN
VSLLFGGALVYGWQLFMAKPAEATISAQTNGQNESTQTQIEPVQVDKITSRQPSASVVVVEEPLKVATTQEFTTKNEELEPSVDDVVLNQPQEFESEHDVEQESQRQQDESSVLADGLVNTSSEPSHSQSNRVTSSVRSAEVTAAAPSALMMSERASVAADNELNASNELKVQEVKADAGTNRLTPQQQGQMAITEVKLTPKQLAQKRFTLANEAERDGKLKDAISYYEQTLGFDPSMHEARKQLAALHYGQGQLAKASEVLLQGMLLFPQQLDFALLLARVQQASGQADLALVTLANIPDTHPLARQKWMAQSDLAQKLGQFSLSEQAYRQLLQQEPQQAKWWMGLAYALDSQQQFPQARQAYRTALGHRGLSAQASAFIEQRLTQLGDSQ